MAWTPDLLPAGDLAQLILMIDEKVLTGEVALGCDAIAWLISCMVIQEHPPKPCSRRYLIVTQPTRPPLRL